jgi:hypothetical protein
MYAPIKIGYYADAVQRNKGFVDYVFPNIDGYNVDAIQYDKGMVDYKNIELSFEGYEDGNVLRDIALGADSGKFMDDITLSFPDGDTLACDFFLSEYEETGEMEEGVTFTATFMSNGVHTHTPAV